MLGMTGLAIVAGLTFSAGPAAASSSTAQGTTAVTQSTQQSPQVDRDRGRKWVHDTYRTRSQCIRVGLIGKRFDRWDRFECERVRRHWRTYYRLEVSRYRDWNDNNNHDWNNNDWNDNKHDWNDKDWNDKGKHDWNGKDKYDWNKDNKGWNKGKGH
jgi:hypothetical protein